MGYHLVAGDAGSKLVVTCKDSETLVAVNLTGKTVKLRYTLDGGAVQVKTMTIQNPATAGKAEYQFGASDLTAGTLTGEVRINEGQDDQVTSVDVLVLSVRAALG